TAPSNNFANPANNPEKFELLQKAKRELLDLATEVSLRNDDDQDLRDELVAFLKALLAFLGDGVGSPPKNVPKSIPDNAKRIAETLKHANSATGSAVTIYEKIIETLGRIFT
ncbi:MAG: hypothetical protein AAFV86_20395, partial [Pseudomonadota bacterium]